MAYSTHLTAALTGASESQLVRWRRPSGDKPAVLVPEHGKVAGRFLYSFRDLIALRTVVYLRDSTSLQLIRQAVDTLERLGDRDHLCRYELRQELRPDGRTYNLMWVDGDTLVSLTDRPGAGQMPVIKMKSVLGPFEVERTGELVPDLFHPSEHIELDPEISGGYPMISGTRVPYDQVADLMRDGVSAADVGSFYPSVSEAAAEDAQRWSEDLLGERSSAA